jgi:hypothetical protein
MCAKTALVLTVSYVCPNHNFVGDCGTAELQTATCRARGYARGAASVKSPCLWGEESRPLDDFWMAEEVDDDARILGADHFCERMVVHLAWSLERP